MGDPGEELVVVWMVVGETKAQTRWWRADEGDGGAIAGSAPVRKWRRRGSWRKEGVSRGLMIQALLNMNKRTLHTFAAESNQLFIRV
jgi:hypothetical protein